MPGLENEKPETERFRAARHAGLTALETRDYARARDHFSEAVRHRPQNSGAVVALATAMLGLGDAETAAALFERSLALAAGEWQFYRRFGLLAAERGNDSLAARGLAEAARLAPGNVAVLNNHAAQLLKAGNPREAAAQWNACLRIDPDYPHAHRGLALAAEAEGLSAEALRHHQAAALSVASPFSWQRDFIRMLTDQQGQDGAIARLRDLAQQRGGDGRLWRLLARAAAASRRPDVEGEAWTALLGVDPSAFDAVLGLAKLADRSGNAAALDQWSARALALEPENAEALYLKGLAAHRRGLPQEARDLLSRSHAINPGSRWTSFLLATLQEAAGDIAAAIAAIGAYIAVSPGDGAALHILAGLQHKSGKEAEAVITLRRAIAASPADVSLRILATNDLLRQGQTEAAWEEARALTAAFPENGRARALLARLDLLSARHEEALAHYEAAARLDPRNVHIAGALVALLNRMGRHSEAHREIARLEAAAGATPEASAMRIATLVSEGRMADAGNAAAEAAAAYPDNVAAVLAVWHLHLAAGNPGKVLAAPEPGGEKSPRERANLQSLRAEAAAQMWDIATALALLRGVSNTPDLSAEFHKRLAWLSLITCDIEQARTHIDLALAAERHELQMRGANVRPLRSLLGSLYADYRLDRQALTAVRAAWDDVPKSLAAVTSYPDYTGAALTLLVALRRRGDFGAAPGLPGLPAIPRRIMQFWDSEQVPDQVLALGQSWRLHNPDFDCQRFSYAAARAFVAARFGADTLKALRRARNSAHKSDIFRLAWLYSEGGVYVDADDRCIASLAPLLADGFSLVCVQEYLGSIGNSFLAAAPGHPVIAACLEEATAAVLRKDNDSIWLSTGPGLLSRVFARMMAAEPGGADRFLAGKRVIDGREFRRFVSGHRPLTYKSTRSAWQNAENARR